MKGLLTILLVLVCLTGLGFVLGAQFASLTKQLSFSPPSSSFSILETTPGETLAFTVLDVVSFDSSLAISYRPRLLSGELREVRVEGLVRNTDEEVGVARDAFVLSEDTTGAYSITLPWGTFVRLTLDDGQSRAWTDIALTLPQNELALSPPERSFSIGVLFVLFCLLLGVVWLLYLLFRHSHHSLLFSHYARRHHPGGYIPLQHS